MSAGLKLPIVVIVVAASIVTASTLWFMTMDREDDDQNDGIIDGIDGQNDDGDESEDGGFSDYTPVTSVSDLVNFSNQFSLDLYQNLIDGDENVFFSPYSITTALSMAYEGARGQTAAEMAEVLELPTDDHARWNMMLSYQGCFNQASDAYNLSTANAYWLAQNADLVDAYRTAIESYYLAHGEELDFAGDPEGSRQIINEWVETQTNGKIKDLIPSGVIDALTYLIITNAIYFKSDWVYQFDPEATADSTFYISDGNTVTAEMMYMHDEDIWFDYYSNDDAQFIRLPYRDNETAMYVLLPRHNNITALESKLNCSYLEGMKGKMSRTYDVSLTLPKFEFEQNYKLKDALTEMGMPTAFSGSADFSGMTEAAALYIEEVIHQSYVKVNEEGTEAAAATAVVVSFGVGPSPTFFNANHPFIFFIEHEETGQILFMGKVENPGG